MSEFINNNDVNDDSRNVFQFNGGRELVDIDRVKVLLDSINKDIDPHKVCLSNKSFSSEAALEIATYIKNYTNITIADISDIIAGRHEDDALKTLQVLSDSFDNTKLIEVNVSDNALGSKGVNACKNLLTGKKLERLYVCNNGLASETSVLLSQILQQGGVAPLKLLHFFNNMSGDDGAVAVGDIIKSCTTLQDLRFSGTRSQKRGCLAAANAINTLTTLNKLDLADNIFKEEAGEILASALGKQTNLVHLNLRDAGLGAENANLVLDAIKNSSYCQNLKFLDLSGNDVDVDCAENLSSMLSSFQSLEELYLDDNEIGTDGITSISKNIGKLPNLKVFSACTNEITAAGAYVLTKALVKINNFSTLKLDGNEINERGVEEIKGLLNRNNKILADMEDNDDEGDDDLDDVLDENENEEDIDLTKDMEKVKI